MKRRGRPTNKPKYDDDYEEDDYSQTNYTSRSQTIGKRGRPKRKASSDEGSIEVESGDEHEHFDGVMSDHPSDVESDSKSSTESKKDQKKPKIKKAKVEQAEEVYVPDPFDLIVELIITDRISAPPQKKNKVQSEQEEDQEMNESEEASQVEQFLVKYKNFSYHEVEWLTESDFSKMSLECQKKLKRYFIKREKLRNGLCVPDAALNLEEGEFFDQHYIQPDKLIMCTNLFPQIHPRQAKTIVDTWRERCVLVHQIICNFRSEHYPHATPFLMLRTEDSPNVLDLTTINNRLYTIPNQNVIKQQQQSGGPQTYYIKPSDFWQDLGQFLRQICESYPSMDTKEGIFATTLRELAYYLYLAWHEQLMLLKDQKPKTDFIKEIKALIERKGQLELQLKAIKQKQSMTPNAQSQTMLGNLSYQNSQLLKEIQQQVTEARLIEVREFPSQTYVVTQESQQAYLQLLKQLPEYIATMPPELNGQVTVDIDKSSAVTLHQIQELLAQLKQKDQSDAQIDGTLQLGQNFMTSLVSGESPPPHFDLSWLLAKGQSVSQLLEQNILEKDKISDMLLKGPADVDLLYLVKWGNLSYLDCTWECASLIREFDQTQTKLKDFERFNRSLDGNARQKLTGFSYAHKQLLKIYEKKVENGKKIDSRSAEEHSTREMLSKLLKFEGSQQSSTGYFQYDFARNLVPQFRLGQKMKDYQIDSLNWMLRAFQDNRNIVLADEMGLGKTIQSMSLLDHLIKINKIRGPFLVLAPLSTLDHWKTVAETWTFMNVVVYHDRNGADGRARVRDTDWYYTDITNKGTITQKSKLTKFNLIITSYEVFNADISHLKEVPFQYVVIDEAHRLKNAQTKTLSLLKEHPCKRILLLTGTPVQNNTKELFTLLNYIESEKFSSFEKFMQQYGTLQSAGQVDQLKEMLKPHFLRRMKDEVEKSIPPLSETVVDVGLTSKQQEYYKGIYGENLALLANLGSIKNINLNNIDMQLRKCCNHLYLLKGVEEEITKNCLSNDDFYNKILESSGKLQLLDKFIDKYKNEGHKMLVFSQFKGMIDIIQTFLGFKKIRCEVLTGTVKSQDRVTSIQRFNEDDQFGVFLLTTRAGGLGINLTKARVVVIFDSDWNPQNDLQAIARAHRIGQKFEIEVYRLITAKTYEQQMFDRASKKLGMEQALFQKGAFGVSDQSDVNKVDPAEVEKLLKYGVYAFLDDDQQENSDQNLNNNNVKIEDILKNKHKTSSKSKVQKTTFNVSNNDGGRNSAKKGKSGSGQKLSVNDPNFWEKVLPFDGFTPKQLLRKFKQKKGDITNTHETQKKFLQDVSKCVKDLIQSKQNDPAFVVDEDIYDLLKKISKCKEFSQKYRDKAQLKLDTILNCDSLILCDQQRFARQAKKQTTDYAEKKERVVASRKGKKVVKEADEPSIEPDDLEQDEEDDVPAEDIDSEGDYDDELDDEEEEKLQISRLVKPETIQDPQTKKSKQGGKQKKKQISSKVTIKMTKKEPAKQTQSSLEEADDQLSDCEPPKKRIKR